MALSYDIKTILIANSTLYAAVVDRVYPVVAPEKPILPCIVYNLDDIQTTEHKDAAFRWDVCSVTVTVIATTLTQAETLGNLVRTALNRYTGTISSDVVKTINITGQSWELVPDFSYAGSSGGVACFAVNTRCVIKIDTDIAE